LRAAGKRGLSDVLGRIEARPDDPDLQALLDEAWARQEGLAIGFTGPPGVGKSTLIGALSTCFRDTGRSVAVLAVDPSSRISGGALLGDRVRISVDGSDAGLYIRSLAARDRLGGLTELATPFTVLFRSLFDLVLIETVGVGQSETDVADLADVVVLCAQPGSGDSVQFMKAGVAEIPDLAVVCKSDLGAPAQKLAADLRGALSLALRAGETLDVMMVSQQDVEAVRALAARLAAWPRDVQARRQTQAGTWLRSVITADFGRQGWRLLSDAQTRMDGSPFATARACSALLSARLNRK
jgi:LAO/AO transport system kinase